MYLQSECIEKHQVELNSNITENMILRSNLDNMDLPIFVIAEWATLLVDIHCPRGGS